MSTKALLQIGSRSGGPVNEYRIRNANVELRTLDATGCPSLLCGRWRVLTADELMLHVSLNTLVAQWLMKRLHVDENYRRLLIGTNLKSPQLHGFLGYVSDAALPEAQYKHQIKTSASGIGRWTRWAGSAVIWLAIVLFLILTPVAVSQASSAGPGTQGSIPDLNSIVQSVEETQLRNLAATRAYTVVRQYKLYHGDDKEPMSEVTAEISLIPPCSKTYEIKQVSGNARGEQIVRQILTLEATPASGDASSEINRRNYDFALLQQENLGTDPAYVVRIIPKRKQRSLLNGQMWVETKTFRILRIEGIPSKKVSWWIKTLHITMQYGELKEMWMATAMQATAVVRLAGSYVLLGKDLTVQPTVVVAEKH